MERKGNSSFEDNVLAGMHDPVDSIVGRLGFHFEHVTFQGNILFGRGVWPIVQRVPHEG